MEKRIRLSPPHLEEKELAFVLEAFESNWIAPIGPNIDGFEKDICEFTGSKFAAALSSGTASIHLALILLGVKENDEVLVSTFTFSASINPIIYQGAIPILIESEPSTWNMSPEFLEESIKSRLKKGKKPKAIVLVHLYGMPSQMEKLLEVATKYNIPIVEDAAEALGSTYEGQSLGKFGQMGVFSFNGNKIITTSGGGALVSDIEDYIIQAKHLASQAKDEAPHYQHSKIGYNYRLSNVCASIGRGQMTYLTNRISRRRANFYFYKNAFQQIDNIRFQEEPSELYYSNRWLTTILIDSKKAGTIDRDLLRLKLEEENIEARPLWKPMHLQPIFKHYPYYGDKLSERLFDQGLCLPSGSSLKQPDLHRITEVILKHVQS